MESEQPASSPAAAASEWGSGVDETTQYGDEAAVAAIETPKNNRKQVAEAPNAPKAKRHKAVGGARKPPTNDEALPPIRAQRALFTSADSPKAEPTQLPTHRRAFVCVSHATPPDHAVSTLVLASSLHEAELRLSTALDDEPHGELIEIDLRLPQVYWLCEEAQLWGGYTSLETPSTGVIELYVFKSLQIQPFGLSALVCANSAAQARLMFERSMCKVRNRFPLDASARFEDFYQKRVQTIVDMSDARCYRLAIMEMPREC